MSHENPHAAWGPNPEYKPPVGDLTKIRDELIDKGANRQTLNTVLGADDIERAADYFNAAVTLAKPIGGDPNILLDRIKNDSEVRKIAAEVIASQNRDFEEEAAQAREKLIREQEELVKREDQKARKLAQAARELVARTHASATDTSTVRLSPSAFEESNFHPQDTQVSAEKEGEKSFEKDTLRISPKDGVIDKES